MKVLYLPEDIEVIEREALRILAEDHPDQQTRSDNTTILHLCAYIRDLRKEPTR